jgi:hypothetical protein
MTGEKVFVQRPYYVAARGLEVFCALDDCPDPVIRVEALPMIAMVPIDDIEAAVNRHRQLHRTVPAE